MPIHYFQIERQIVRIEILILITIFISSLVAELLENTFNGR